MNVIQTDDGSPTLFSERYNESFHSTFGAATESRYVFLEASGVLARLKSGQPTRVLEVGFGLGLNALLSCDAAITFDTALSYHTYEHDYGMCELNRRVDFAPLLVRPELATMLQDSLKRVQQKTETDPPASSSAEANLSTESDLSITEANLSTESDLPTTEANLTTETDPPTTDANLITETDPPTTEANLSRISAPSTLVEFTPETVLRLHWSDVATQHLPSGEFDAIYLDAFSPDNNPECWTVEFFTRLKKSMAPHAKLSTYCAKGNVRRALIASGLTVTKLPGPPGKREIMVATLNSDE